jgi:hypothetical protein
MVALLDSTSITGAAARVAPSPFALAARELLAAGYHPIPIKPEDKAPGSFDCGRWQGMTDWTQYASSKPSIETMRTWLSWPDAGVGVVTGTRIGEHVVIALDFDTSDDVELDMLAACVPLSPMEKVGRRGFTRFYLADPATKTKRYAVPTGEGNKKRCLLEILAGNAPRQSVMPPSIHPNTGAPYAFTTSAGIVPAHTLPLLDSDHIERLEDTLRALGWQSEATREHVACEASGDDAGDDGESIWAEINRVALANLSAWVPALGLTRFRRARGGFEAVNPWRESGSGRPFDQRSFNLSIQPSGIKDWGTSEGYSALDIVQLARECTLDEAFAWLRDKLGLRDDGLDGLTFSNTTLLEENGTPHDPRMGENLEKSNELEKPNLTLVVSNGAPAPTASTWPVESLFDPWEQYTVPAFPLDILPEPVARFVKSKSQALGCDLGGVAMSALTVFSGALHHEFSLKLMRHSDFRVSPRLWVMLVGDPSSKKTPMQKDAIKPLRAIENRQREAHDADVLLHQVSGGSQNNAPLPPPRYIATDTTVEKLGELLSRSPRGILIHRDELSGWIGSMEKYAAGKGGGADRAFWLQTYDGGSYTVDRISRGDIYVHNLSASILGGIQPARLAELGRLTSDGLLQRFIPVMLSRPTFGEDSADDEAASAYAALIEQCASARPTQLELSNAALAAMNSLRAYIFDLEQSSGALGAGFQSFVGKLTGMVGSLTLILHMAAEPHARVYTAVGAEAVKNVERLIKDFVLPNAREFYQRAEARGDSDGLQQLASWILTSGKRRILASDFASNVRVCKGAPLAAINDCVSPLVAGGWLKPERPGPSPSAWLVNPALASQFKQRGIEEEYRKQRVAKLMNSDRRGRRNS